MLPPGDLGDGPSPPPAASIVCVNIMWLMSFVLSITSTLFATLALHWARRFTQLHRILNTSRDRTHIRSFSCCGTLRYDIRRAVSMIVIFLHLSVPISCRSGGIFFHDQQAGCHHSLDGSRTVWDDLLDHNHPCLHRSRLPISYANVWRVVVPTRATGVHMRF
jgi:hypothetical protein